MARYKLSDFKGDDGVLLRHPGTADFDDLSTQVGRWLVEKGFEVDVLRAGSGGTLVQGKEPTSLKTAIGASAPLEVELSPDSRGTRVDVRMGKVGGSVWMARLFTYSWVALGVTFLPLKKELETFVQDLVVRQGTHGISDALTCLGVQETGRSEYPLGTEERRIDNSANGSEVTRSIKATKRWTQSCQIEREHSQANRLGGDLKMFDLVTVSSQAETTVRKKYAISSDVEQTFEEQITLTVPKSTSVLLRMDWKKIVQHGYIRFRNQHGQIVDIPYQVDVGVTFDQRQSEF
jgi:hypothetical protein